ncbi:hypothetical protein C8R43DRAFT_965665 [Mycena crocata]|nr:hypothetical protein C8R43DRAFT_965665 [Mycena crocata]
MLDNLYDMKGATSTLHDYIQESVNSLAQQGDLSSQHLSKVDTDPVKVQSTGTVKKSWHLVVDGPNGEEEELVIFMQGILSKVDLIPRNINGRVKMRAEIGNANQFECIRFTGKKALKLSRYVELTGGGSDLFKQGVENVQAINNYVGRYFLGVPLAKCSCSGGPDNIGISNRYFTSRTVVQYFKAKHDITTHVGDIVEVQMSMITFNTGRNVKMFSRLQAVTLLDNQYSKVKKLKRKIGYGTEDLSVKETREKLKKMRVDEVDMNIDDTGSPKNHELSFSFTFSEFSVKWNIQSHMTSTIPTITLEDTLSNVPDKILNEIIDCDLMQYEENRLFYAVCQHDICRMGPSGTCSLGPHWVVLERVPRSTNKCSDTQKTMSQGTRTGKPHYWNFLDIHRYTPANTLVEVMQLGIRHRRLVKCPSKHHFRYVVLQKLEKVQQRIMQIEVRGRGEERVADSINIIAGYPLSRVVRLLISDQWYGHISEPLLVNSGRLLDIIEAATILQLLQIDNIDCDQLTTGRTIVSSAVTHFSFSFQDEDSMEFISALIFPSLRHLRLARSGEPECIKAIMDHFCQHMQISSEVGMKIHKLFGPDLETLLLGLGHVHCLDMRGSSDEITNILIGVLVALRIKPTQLRLLRFPMAHDNRPVSDLLRSSALPASCTVTTGVYDSYCQPDTVWKMVDNKLEGTEYGGKDDIGWKQVGPARCTEFACKKKKKKKGKRKIANRGANTLVLLVKRISGWMISTTIVANLGHKDRMVLPLLGESRWKEARLGTTSFNMIWRLSVLRADRWSVVRECKGGRLPGCDGWLVQSTYCTDKLSNIGAAQRSVSKSVHVGRKTKARFPRHSQGRRIEVGDVLHYGVRRDVNRTIYFESGTADERALEDGKNPVHKFNDLRSIPNIVIDHRGGGEVEINICGVIFAWQTPSMIAQKEVE